MPVPEIIIESIKSKGPLSFHDFMEMALYYPGQGYYASPRDKLGEAGDFYTSPYLTCLFGEMIAGQLEEMWRNMGCRAFTIVEYGAGTGLLCRDILTRLRGNSEMFHALQYVIIEKSGPMRRRERELLAAEGLLHKLRWEASIDAVAPIHGCVLSNELVDNFAVHRVVMEDELMEVFVGYDDGFVELLRPASAELKDYLHELQVTLPRGFRAEINLEATRWIGAVSAALGHGFVITIDYGGSSSGLYDRSEGTLACYHHHQVSHSPYESVGEQDITSNVNFSALDHWGRRGGLEHCGFTSQTHFLQGLGLNRRLQQLELEASPTNLRQLHTLLIGMSSKFKVLIQRKGVGRQFLSGLQFTQVLA